MAVGNSHGDCQCLKLKNDTTLPTHGSSIREERLEGGDPLIVLPHDQPRGVWETGRPRVLSFVPFI